MPTQSPSSVLPVLSSSRTGVHSPDRSTPPTPAAGMPSGYCCARAGTLANVAARPIARTTAAVIWRMRDSLVSVGPGLKARPPEGRPEGRPLRQTNLKHVLERELYDARVARRRQLAEGARGDVQVRRHRVVPLEPVECVER